MKATASAARIIFRISITSGVAIAILTSFFAYKALDANVPYGSKSFFVVTSIADDLTEGEASSILSDAAYDYNVNLFRVAQITGNAGTERILYVFRGDVPLYERLYPGNTYPSFGKDASTTFKTPRDMGRVELLGAYSTTSDAGELFGLVQHLRDSGISVSVEQVSFSRALSETFTLSPFAPLMWGTLLGIGLGTVYFVSQRQRLLKIKALHGHTGFRSGVVELTETALYFGTCCLIAAPITAIGLAGYNDLHQIGSFAAQTLTTLAVLLTATLLTQVCVLIFLSERSEVEVIKGKRPPQLVSIATLAAQIAVLTLTFLTMSQAAGQVADLNQNEEMLQNWEEAGEYVGIEFDGQSNADFKKIVSGFGSVVDELEKSKQIVLAYNPMQPTAGDFGLGPDHGNSLIVNPAYLEEQTPELSSTDEEYPALLESADILLLVPESYADQVEELERDYVDWAEFQRSQWPAPTSSQPLTVQTLLTASNQTLFNYDHSGVDIIMGQSDPVLAVIPSSSRILPAQFYVAVASQGGLLFKDAQVLSNEIAAAGLADQIRSFTPAADLARLAVDQQLLDAAVRAPVTAFLAILLLLTSLLSGSVQYDKYRIENFVRRVHGVPPIRAHSVFLLVLFLSALIAVAVSAIGWAALGIREIAIGALCIGLSILGSTLGIVLFERQFRFEILRRL